MADLRPFGSLTRILCLLLVVCAAVHCDNRENTIIDRYSTVPKLERSVPIIDGGDTLRPARLQMVDDTLYVSYVGQTRLDLFTPELEKIRSIVLDKPESVHPTSFVVADSEIIVTDHAKRIVAAYDFDGGFLTSFGLLPDEATRLSPLVVTYYGGVAYVADIALRKVLAISMTDAPEITERGELILTIPPDSGQTVGFPSAICVTPDGRLLVGDAEDGLVRVFTCDGRPVYNFDSVFTDRPLAPQGFAIDDIIDPELQDTSSFDPSGIRYLGRIHVVDGNNAAVHLFSPLGRFIASYPSGGELVRPSGIAIDRARKKIYIADPVARRIFMYRYQDGGDA